MSTAGATAGRRRTTSAGPAAASSATVAARHETRSSYPPSRKAKRTTAANPSAAPAHACLEEPTSPSTTRDGYLGGVTASETLVFIPAWNEEENFRPCSTSSATRCPRPTCSSSTTAPPIGRPRSRASTAPRCSRSARTAASAQESPRATAGRTAGYAFCGRVDADGQHPAAELKRLLELVRSGEADVAVGSRFVSGPGYEPYRYEPEDPTAGHRAAAPRHARRARPPVPRRHERSLRGQREGAAAARSRTRAARPRWRRCFAWTRPGCTWRRCRSTCALVPAASRSCRARRRSFSCGGDRDAVRRAPLVASTWLGLSPSSATRRGGRRAPRSARRGSAPRRRSRRAPMRSSSAAGRAVATTPRRRS